MGSLETKADIIQRKDNNFEEMQHTKKAHPAVKLVGTGNSLPSQKKQTKFFGMSLPPGGNHFQSSYSSKHEIQKFSNFWKFARLEIPKSTSQYVIAKDEEIRSFFKSAKDWDKIKMSLNELVESFDAVQHHDLDTVSRVVQHIIKTYNEDWQQSTNFATLHKVIKNSDPKGYIAKTISRMAKEALKLQQVLPLVCLSSSENDVERHLNADQIGILLANAFFCTFPKEDDDFSLFNFKKLFDGDHRIDSKAEKLKAMFHYFEKHFDHPHHYLVTYKRRILKDADILLWNDCHAPIGEMTADSTGSIEVNGSGMLQVDFANQFVGGGVLGNGALMEEIRFSMCPELIICCLLASKLHDNEVFYVRGFRQYGLYKGYGHTFKFDRGSFSFPDHGIENELVLMDAYPFPIARKHIQYQCCYVVRELNKCYAAFHPDTSQNPNIASGNWGCGAFNGDPQLKFLIQLMAASACKKKLHMFTFGGVKEAQSYSQMHKVLREHQFTVGQVYNVIRYYNEHFLSRTNYHGHFTTLFTFILDNVKSNGSGSVLQMIGH